MIFWEYKVLYTVTDVVLGNDREMIAKITDILDNCEKYRIHDKKFLLHVQQTNYPLTENDKCCMHNFLILEQLL